MDELKVLFEQGIVSSVSQDFLSNVNEPQQILVLLSKNEYFNCYTVVLKINDSANSFDFNTLDEAIKKYLLLLDFFS